MYDIVSVIIFNTIGGIIMPQSNLEKQEAKLKQLNQKIKAEKNKIDQNLGKQIIRSANLDYVTLTTPQIKMIAKKVAAFLNQAQNNR
jgi:tetrahydromethanopterin S-methyltransferase subunit G